MKTRYAADYIASVDDLPDDPDFDPADVSYSTVYGEDREAVADKAAKLDINGECYALRLEEYVELHPGDGIFDWRIVDDC